MIKYLPIVYAILPFVMFAAGYYLGFLIGQYKALNETLSEIRKNK